MDQLMEYFEKEKVEKKKKQLFYFIEKVEIKKKFKKKGV